jgi:hypothetical protein
MARYLPGVVGIVLLCGYGIAEGVLANRWRGSEALDQAAARLTGVPRNVGEWEGTDQEMNPREFVVAELRGAVWRHYTHRRSGEAVTVLLVCGRGGPVAVHTPDVCFAGQGFALQGRAERRSLTTTAGPAEFHAGRFEKPGPVGAEACAVLWAWTVDGAWEAPTNPRVRYAREQAVYKLYLIHVVGYQPGAPAANVVLTDFASAFVPAVHDALFPPAR